MKNFLICLGVLIFAALMVYFTPPVTRIYLVPSRDSFQEVIQVHFSRAVSDAPMRSCVEVVDPFSGEIILGFAKLSNDPKGEKFAEFMKTHVSREKHPRLSHHSFGYPANAIPIPETLRFLSQVSPESSKQRVQVVFFASPLYRSPEARFDFVNGRLPGDAHLLGELKDTPFATAGLRLPKWSVYFVIPPGPENSWAGGCRWQGVEALRFWSLYCDRAGGALKGCATSSSIMWLLNQNEGGSPLPFRPLNHQESELLWRNGWLETGLNAGTTGRNGDLRRSDFGIVGTATQLHLGGGSTVSQNLLEDDGQPITPREVIPAVSPTSTALPSEVQP